MMLIEAETLIRFRSENCEAELATTIGYGNVSPEFPEALIYMIQEICIDSCFNADKFFSFVPGRAASVCLYAACWLILYQSKLLWPS